MVRNGYASDSSDGIGIGRCVSERLARLNCLPTAVRIGTGRSAGYAAVALRALQRRVQRPTSAGGYRLIHRRPSAHVGCYV